MTVQALDRRLRRKVIALSMSAALGGFLFGFDSSVVNGAVDSVQAEFNLPAVLTGFAVASALFGCAIGAFAAGRLADRCGRVSVMVIGAGIFFGSSIGSGLAFSVWDLVIWRAIGGLGIGIASVIAPAYIAEISPKAIRGRLSSLQQLAITLGIFAALMSDAQLAGFAHGASNPLWFGVEAWRWMFIVCAIPAVIYGIIAWKLPESPRYLLLKTRPVDARAVLSLVLPQSELDDAVRTMEQDIAIDRATAKSASLRGNAFGLAPVVWVGILLSMFQQLVGINVIFYYSTTLWSMVGFAELHSFAISVGTSIVNVAVTFVAIGFVDRVGRRLLLLAGSTGMALSLGVMSLAFSQAFLVDSSPVLPREWAIAALIAANAFVVSFGATWGPVVWVVLAEIFPTRIRAKALGLAGAILWCMNFVVTVTFPVLSQGFSLAVAYGIYAFFALLSLVFVFVFVPETKGIALEGMTNLKFSGLWRSTAHR